MTLRRLPCAGLAVCGLAISLDVEPGALVIVPNPEIKPNRTPAETPETRVLGVATTGRNRATRLPDFGRESARPTEGRSRFG